MNAPAKDSGLRVVTLLCAAEVLSMTGFSTYPALLAPLREAWGMSGAEAGFIGGVFFAGYMAAVPLLSALTDRIDARRVYFLSTLLAVAGTLGFGLFASIYPAVNILQALGMLVTILFYFFSFFFYYVWIAVLVWGFVFKFWPGSATVRGLTPGGAQCPSSDR